MSILLPLLIGIALSALLWRKHWGLSLGLGLGLMILGAAIGALVIYLPVNAYARLPLEGRYLGLFASWGIASGFGLLLPLPLKAYLGHLRKGAHQKEQ